MNPKNRPTKPLRWLAATLAVVGLGLTACADDDDNDNDVVDTPTVDNGIDNGNDPGVGNDTDTPPVDDNGTFDNDTFDDDTFDDDTFGDGDDNDDMLDN
jgi:hypothetical protein